MPQPSLPRYPRARHERGRPRQHQARTRGLKASTFVTRVAVAASVALTGAFSAIAAAAFPGHADRGTPVTHEADRSPAPLVALPPPNSGTGGLPAPPPQAPVPGIGSGQVGSGGS
jgi:hypothetical protein